MARDGIRFNKLRRRLDDGGATTVYVVRYPRARTRLDVRHFPRLERLDRWCRRVRVREAIVGGFFVRPHGPALGEVWVGGERVQTQPFRPPFDRVRAAVSVESGRYPRTALGLSSEHLIAVACDGRRSNRDSGLTLHELAELLLDLDARSAINLDGGGSSTLVHRGRQRNRPYETQDVRVRSARRIATALVFDRR
jgi:hypothetical protein